MNKLKRITAKVFSGAALISTAMLAGASYANTIDVLVVYSDTAADVVPGGDMPARIASMIAYSNGAYRNSGVDIELRLVGLENYNPSYGDTVDGETLSLLRTDQSIAQLRQQVGADLVTFITPRLETQEGYFNCGIGYIPGGANGQLWNNAASLGYSIVSSNCDLSTFTHELGHNMGLNHSPRQDGSGGLWTWARGYGVDGEFATTMAYGSLYNTRNRLQVLSNPDIDICEGYLCGSAQGNSDESNAAEALNRVADQIAAYFPSTLPDTDDVQDELAACSDKQNADNLIVNGSFNSDVGGWSQILNASSIEPATLSLDGCMDKVLQVGSRSQSYGNATYNLGNTLDNGASYQLTADVRLLGPSARDDFNVAVQLNTQAGTSYQFLPGLSITSENASEYIADFTLNADDALESTALIFYGPSAGTDFILDDVILRKTSDAPAPIASSGFSEDFEGQVSGWTGNDSAEVSVSSIAYSGASSLLSNNREYWYSGPAKEATGLILPGVDYEFSFVAGFTGVSSSQPVRAYLYYVDSERAKWQKVSDVVTAASTWTSYSGSFSFEPVGAVSQVRFHVMGPNPGINLYVDDVVVK